MKLHIPFRKLDSRGWQNLGLLMVLAFYVIRVGVGIYSNGLTSVPGDFICFWTAGRLANAAGYARVYDLNALYEFQKSIVPTATVVLPMFYLPVFILPFQVLALIPIVQSYWLWMGMNILFLVTYLRLFIKRIPASIPGRTLLMIIVAFPVFQNFYAGQVNLLLMLAVGEFFHALVHKKPWRAGIWLALLLLKPQTLILILPVLLFQRNWKTIVGFGITSALVGLLSFVLIGAKGLDGFSASWLVASKSNATVMPEIMVNWRMLALRLGAFTVPILGWILAAAGIAATIFLTFALWRKSVSPASPAFILGWFGTIAATLLLSWHSHVHMGVILIPLLCYLFPFDLLPSRTINVWCFLPFLTLLAGVVIFSVLSLLAGIKVPTTLVDFLLSLGLLMASFYFLVWSYRKMKDSPTASWR
jgi:hypothetical protein